MDANIISLLSVIGGAIVGSLATGFIASRAENKKLKIENIEKIVAPYCSILEEIKESKIDNFDKWIKKLNEPSLYLRPNKIIYLTESSKELLCEYKKQLNEFKNIIEQEYNDIKSKYDEILLNKIKIYFYNHVDCSDLNYSNDLKDKLKLAILNKNIDFQMSKELSSVNAYIDMKGYDDLHKVNINHDWAQFEEEDQYISYEEYEIECENQYILECRDLGIDENGLNKCLYSIEKNKEIKFVEGLINDTKSKELKNNLLNQIDKMIKQSKKEIDKNTKVYKK